MIVAQEAETLGSLAQYGAVGLILVLSLLALRAVYQQQITTLRETVVAERARADRTEAELMKLNGDVRDRLITSMSTSAEAFREALRTLEGRR